MQEQKAKSGWKIAKKIGVKDLIGLTLFSGLMLTILVVLLYTYRNVPVAHWREFHSDFPLKGAGLVVEDVRAEWKSSQGNARLELRTAYYPEINLTLGGGSGSGILFLKFVNSRRAEQGTPVALRYQDGAFLPVNDINMKADGQKAMALIERGFPTAHDYRLHQLSLTEPLWRVQIFQRPSDSKVAYYLGDTTIAPIAE